LTIFNNENRLDSADIEEAEILAMKGLISVIKQKQYKLEEDSTLSRH
jgi:hypothetical protein